MADRQTDGWTDGGMDRRMDGHRWMDERTDGPTDGQTDKVTSSQLKTILRPLASGKLTRLAHFMFSGTVFQAVAAISFDKKENKFKKKKRKMNN